MKKEWMERYAVSLTLILFMSGLGFALKGIKGLTLGLVPTGLSLFFLTGVAIDEAITTSKCKELHYKAMPFYDAIRILFIIIAIAGFFLPFL